ncbi:equilibrative nucleoside transporter 3 [Onthophagus taurus]|uniref:equilibrative nucleoside transporter 3 n=1 Tax=Onthophagus taurus TaxID=166361 RepID=UPI000C1FE815|nr:equilibrative nucleoside transporter 3 [Onthophagus taurus]
MEYSINTRPLLQDSDTENEDIITQSYEETSVSVQNDKPLFKPPEPKDKYHMAYIIFYILGITTLLPWNFFITADDYWMYKFRDTTANLSSSYDKRTPLQAEFTSYLSLASSVPNILFLVLNTALNHKVSVQKRVIGSLIVMLILFIVTTVFVNIDTDKYQDKFFIITITCVVLLNISSAILSGSIFGIMGKFSPKYITATIGGQALGGIFAAIAQIISLTLGVSSVHSAFVYFMVGNTMIFITLISYVILSKTVFFKYHISEKTGITLNEFQNELVRPRIVDHKLILKKIFPYGTSVFLVFLISLSCYPGLTVLIESQNHGNGDPWADVYFVPVIAYLLFSTGDYIGRLLAGKIQKPRRGIWIVLLTVLRIVFIPLLIFSNAQPREHLPVLFHKDYEYIMILFVFALTNGYLANLSLICAPRVVDHHEKETASSMMTVFLGIGLAIGAAISLLIVKVI